MMMNAAIIRKKPNRIRSVNQIHRCGSRVGARAGKANSIRMGDDWPSSGPRRSGRQSLSTILLIGRMPLSHFCNAVENRLVARRMEGWFARSKNLRPQHRHPARQTQGAAFPVYFFRKHAMRGTPCLAKPNSRPPPPRKAPVPKAPWEVLLRRKHSACSGAVENFKSPKHHDDGRYQRGRHQHTFQGSDSHPLTLRFQPR
jgi:hypothetical protein